MVYRIILNELRINQIHQVHRDIGLISAKALAIEYECGRSKYLQDIVRSDRLGQR